VVETRVSIWSNPSCINGGIQSIYLEQRKLYRWWRPEYLCGPNQAVLVVKPKYLSETNQAVLVVKPEYISGRNQAVLVVGTRVSLWNKPNSING